jgi:hypothetical protein
MDLGSVRVKIEGDPSKLQADLKAAEAAAANAGSKIAQAFNKSAGSINDTTTATKKAVSGITQTGEAAEKAGQKVQSFVGAIPGMGVAAERFIGLVPGLGAGLLAIFPVLGAIAFAEGLGRVATSIGNAIDEAIGLKKAMEQLADATKEADSAIASLGKTVDSINVDRMTEQFGKASGLKLKAGLGAAEAQADFVKARELYASIDRLKKEFELNNAVNPGVLIPGVRGDIYAQQKATLDKLQQDAIAADAKGKERLLRAQKDLDDSETEKVKAGKEALKKQNEGWETRYRLFETELAETKSIRDSQLKATADFNEKMLQLSEQGAKDLAEQQQRWKKINIDAKDQRVTQSKIEAPVASRIAGPLAAALELKDAGIQTAQMREAEIAENQRLLNMAEQMNVPLGTQLQLREQILQQQIALSQEQGRNPDNELIGLRKLQDQQDRMRQSPKATLHSGLSSVAGTDQTLGTKLSVTGVQLAANMVDGLASTLARAAVEGGKLGHMLRDVGKQLAMTAATSVLKMGLQAALQGILKLIPAFAGVATAQVGAAATSHAATSALNVGSVMSYAAVGAAAAAASTAAIPIVGPLLAPGAAAAIYAQISSFAPLAAFADGGRPEPGKMAIVGERGPELFIPDQAGRIVPNHQLAGGAGLSLPSASASSGNSVGSMSFHAYGLTNPEKFVDYVAHRLPDRIKKTSARFSPAASR